MENEYFNQRIACHVTSCKYHDSKQKRCTLGEILVDGSKEKKSTFCNNFKEN